MGIQNRTAGYNDSAIFARHAQAAEIQRLPESMTVAAWPEHIAARPEVSRPNAIVVSVSRSNAIVVSAIFSASATSELKSREWITDFSGEPYRVLRAIPVTVRDLDIEGVEVAFEDGNIAWVADGRVDAVNGLKAEILNTIEDLESNTDRLGPGPKKQLDILLSYLERIA